jgi:hypothetical protein
VHYISLTQGLLHLFSTLASNTVQAADGSVLMSGLSGRGSSRPKNTLPLLTSTVKMDADDPAMRCCFRWVREGTLH